MRIRRPPLPGSSVYFQDSRGDSLNFVDLVLICYNMPDPLSPSERTPLVAVNNRQHEPERTVSVSRGVAIITLMGVLILIQCK